ncbi:MAG: S8 family serine peptidase [Eubacterium sp.]|nr:S8 family serine peptidase [Eubacterium sp.]
MDRKKIFAVLLSAVAAFSPVLSATAVSVQAAPQEVEVPELEEGTYVKGEALVSMTTTQAAALTKEGTVSFDSKIQVEECWEFGAAEGAQSEQIKDYVALVRSDTYTTEELMEIAAEKYYVDAVAPNSYAHLCDTGKDLLSDYQWYLDGDGQMQTNSQGIRFSGLSVSPSIQPVVAVIDTGVDYTHEDLKDSMWVNPYQSKGLEGTYGYDFANDDNDPMDTEGHGTHCAGVIAAQQDNGIGVTGISNAKIMALKVVKDDSDVFDMAGAVRAFEYIVRAQQLGVPVAAVNCSWGGSRDTGAILNTLIDKMGANGALTVFAAGNDAIDWDAVASPMRLTPYDLTSQYVVVVGASDENDDKVYFSDYGNTLVDLFAPGSNIVSTVQQEKFLPQFMPQEKRSQMTSYYSTVNSIADFHTAQDIQGVGTNYTVRLSYEPNIGFLDEPDGCLKYTVSYNRKGGFPFLTDNSIVKNNAEQAGFIYLDVTSLGLDPNKTYYISCLMAENEGDVMPAWESVEKISTPQNSRFITAGGRTYLALIGISTQKTRATTYYFDNFAVSVADPDTAQFEKCDIMSGSSMAAPVVSGAVAVLSGTNPSLDAAGLRSLLMKCTRNIDTLENACVTGGILDLSRVVVQASRLKLNKASANIRYGKTLKLVATLLPQNVTNAKVIWKSSNSKYASVSASGVVKVKKAGIGKTVKITASTADGTGLKKTCKVKILKAAK